MDSQAFAALADSYAEIDLFLIVAARIFGFVIIMPTLAGSSIPTNVRICFSAAIAFLVVTTGKIIEIDYSQTVAGLALFLVQEFIVGFLIAFFVYLVFSIVYYAGQLIDMQIGFSMVSVLDPLTQIQVPILGNLLYFVISIFFIRSGGLHSFIQTLFYSYDVLPVGKAFIIGNGAILSNTLKIVSEYFVLGLRFSMPIVGTILILDIALGLLVKASPQMNIFVVGMPIKLIVGLFVLYVIVPSFYEMFVILYNTALDMVMSVLRGLMTS